MTPIADDKEILARYCYWLHAEQTRVSFQLYGKDHTRLIPVMPRHVPDDPYELVPASRAAAVLSSLGIYLGPDSVMPDETDGSVAA